MNFNFKELQRKYARPESRHQKQEEIVEKLVMFEDLKVNPLVLEECKKLEKDYITYYNNNRYFYLHTEPTSIDIIDKIKKDQFAQIRRKYEVSLAPPTPNKEQGRNEIVPRRKNRAEAELKRRHLFYLFRKNIKIIISKMIKQKITMQDIFEKKLFSDQPYCFGKEIFEAVKSGQETKVWRFYIENRFVIYSIDTTGKTLLSWASIRGHSAIAEMLIGMGVSLNRRDLHGHTPLYYALQYRNLECAKILLLHETFIGPEDIQKAQQEKRLKNMIELSQSIMAIIRKMPYDKRKLTFEESLKHLT